MADKGEKEGRLAAELRANLARRKAQARSRRLGEAVAEATDKGAAGAATLPPERAAEDE